MHKGVSNLGTKVKWSGLIAHECCHAVDQIFHYVDEEKPGAETAAYLMQWLVDSVHKVRQKVRSRVSPNGENPAVTEVLNVS